MTFAPVIVFNYNRPNHSIQTWEALANNVFASETELFLYCDGPKNEDTEDNRSRIEVMHNRALEYAEASNQKEIFKEVHVVLSDRNKGLAKSIIGGVTDILRSFEQVIVLEDDLLTSPYFLKYMNEALSFYKYHPSVMSISSNRPPVNKMLIPKDYSYDVFVSLRPFSTGWATWRDRWSLMDWSMDYLPAMLKDTFWIESFNRGGDDLTDMLCLQRDGIIDSWAIRWAYSHFKEHCVGILPCVPYVDNIGFDGSGIHSGNDDKDFRNDVMKAPKNPRFLETIYEDKRIINSMADYYSKKKRPLWQKLYNRVAIRLGFDRKNKTKVFA